MNNFLVNNMKIIKPIIYYKMNEI